MKPIALASDHGGFELKQEVKAYLAGRGIPFKDFGTDTPASCDYAHFGCLAAGAVASGDCERGIVICGTGVGISIAANKVKGIRCALCGDGATARLTKQHNNANMIALGGRIIGAELAREIIEQWLAAEFEGGRHQRRIDQIAQIENGESV